MKTGTAALLLLLLAATACGTDHPPAAPQDPTLQKDARAGSLAVSLDRPQEAITQYRRALHDAWARDDVTAIGDYGYDLAVAQLAANRPKDALTTLHMVRDELARRGGTAFAALDLAEATTDYRLGDLAQCDRLAARAATGGDAAVAGRAVFLRGLVADETNNVNGLDMALAGLAQPAGPDQQADAEELRARRDLRQGQYGAAYSEALHATELRRTLLDYRGMARALTVAGDAAAQSGKADAAADLYLRAGQSAAAQGDAVNACPWLRRAVQLQNDPAVHEAADRAAQSLESGASPGVRCL